MLIPKKRTGYSRVTHPFATLTKKCKHPSDPVRLACVKHAASVHPEPGSNSPTKTKKQTQPKTQAKTQTQDQIKNDSSQKTIQQKQTPTIKKQNVPKSSASKNKNKKKPNPPQKTRQAQSNPTQTKQKNTLSRTQTTKPQTNEKRSVKVTARKTRESQSNRFDFRLSTYF